MAAVTVYHLTATMTGVGPPMVNHAFGGAAHLVPTDSYPSGQASVRCESCGEIILVSHRSPQQRRAATKTMRRKPLRFGLVMLAASLLNFMLSLAWANQQGHLLESLKDSNWVVCSGALVFVSLTVLLAAAFMKAEELVVDPAGGHTATLR